MHKETGFRELSFVIPCYGSVQVVRDCLLSIRNQSLPQYEIILVVSGVEDISAARAFEGPDLRILHSKERLFAGQARNWGAREARYEVLAFIDADCRLGESWSYSLSRLSGDWDAVVGLKAWDKSQNDWIKAFHIFEFHEFTGTRMQAPPFLDSGNLVIGRKVFNSIGGFSETLESHEDYYFLSKSQKSELELVYSPDMSVIHFSYVPSPQALETKAEKLGNHKGRLEKERGGFRAAILKSLPWPLIGLLFFSIIGMRLTANRSLYWREYFRLAPIVIRFCLRWSFGLRNGLREARES